MGAFSIAPFFGSRDQYPCAYARRGKQLGLVDGKMALHQDRARCAFRAAGRFARRYHPPVELLAGRSFRAMIGCRRGRWQSRGTSGVGSVGASSSHCRSQGLAPSGHLGDCISRDEVGLQSHSGRSNGCRSWEDRHVCRGGLLDPRRHNEGTELGGLSPPGQRSRTRSMRSAPASQGIRICGR